MQAYFVQAYWDGAIVLRAHIPLYLLILYVTYLINFNCFSRHIWMSSMKATCTMSQKVSDHANNSLQRLLYIIHRINRPTKYSFKAIFCWLNDFLCISLDLYKKSNSLSTTPQMQKSSAIANIFFVIQIKL